MDVYKKPNNNIWVLTVCILTIVIVLLGVFLYREIESNSTNTINEPISPTNNANKTDQEVKTDGITEINKELEGLDTELDFEEIDTKTELGY